MFAGSICDNTIALSDDGEVHSFGRNREGTLGLGHKCYISNPNSESSRFLADYFSQFVLIMKVLYAHLEKINMQKQDNNKYYHQSGGNNDCG